MRQAIFGVFLALGFLIYGWFLNNPFIMDDEDQILGNVHIQSIENIPSFFTASSFASGGREKMTGIYYKPLMTSYFAVIWNFYGAEPAPYRLPLLVLHILSAYLVFLFSLSFLPLLHSLFVGLLFLVHPVNSEVTLYISDAQDVFYFFFGILSLVCIEKVKSVKILAPLLILLFSCALMSKETGGLFLAIAGVYVLLIRREKFRPVFFAAALVSISYFILRWQIGLTSLKSPALLFQSLKWVERIEMLPLVFGHYIEIFFLPWRLSLTTDLILKSKSWSQFWFPLLIVISFLSALFFARKHIQDKEPRRYFDFFLCAFFFWFLLHTHVLVPLDGVYADRWFYLGVWILLSLVGLFFSRRLSQKNVAIVGLAILLPMGARSFMRAQDWQDPLRLYQREASIHPWDAIMNNNVGVELFRRNRIDESESYFTTSVSQNPRWNVSLNNLGAVKEHQGKLSEALDLYLKAVNIGAYPLAYENYARLLLRMGRVPEARLFLKNQALPVFPNNAALLNLYEVSLRTN